MIDQKIKCDPEILFKITKKEADFAFKLPKQLQDEFEDYQRLKYKFDCLSKTSSITVQYTAPYHPAVH